MAKWQADPAWLKRLRDRNQAERKRHNAETRNYRDAEKRFTKDRRPEPLKKKQEEQSRQMKRLKEARAHKIDTAKREHKPFRLYIKGLAIVAKTATAPELRWCLDVDLADLVHQTKADTLPRDLRFILLEETRDVISKVSKRSFNGDATSEIPWDLPYPDSHMEARAALKTDEVQ